MPDAPRRASRAAGAALAALLVLSAAAPAQAEPPDPDPWIARDKALHFGVAAAITGGGYALCTLVADDVLARSLVGVGYAVSAISLKEAIDWAGYGHPSLKDVVWGFAGTAVGLGVSISIDLAVRSAQAPKKP